MCEKHKPETRVSERHKLGFGKMNGFPRAPGFPKPGFQSLVHNGVSKQQLLTTSKLSTFNNFHNFFKFQLR